MTRKNTDVTDRRIEAQENTDIELYQRFIDEKTCGEYTVTRTGQYEKYDAVQVNHENGEKIVLEFKTRNIPYEQYPDYIFSFRKLDQLQEAKMLNEATRSLFAAFYPISSKIVIFDLTNLNSKNTRVDWMFMKHTEYDDNSEKEWQPVVKLKLDPTHDDENYRTYVYDFKMDDYEQIYQKNWEKLGK